MNRWGDQKRNKRGKGKKGNEDKKKEEHVRILWKNNHYYLI
jgi:hypothetical protein